MNSTSSINGWNSPCNPGNVVVPKSSCPTPLTVRSHQSPNSSKSIAIPSLPISASSRHGLAAEPTAQLGAPPRLSKQQIAAIWRLADQAATTLGLPLGRWSLAKLRVPHPPDRIVPTISREHLRRVLKKGGTHFAASVASSSAPIPIGI